LSDIGTVNFVYFLLKHANTMPTGSLTYILRYFVVERKNVIR